MVRLEMYLDICVWGFDWDILDIFLVFIGFLGLEGRVGGISGCGCKSCDC